MSTPCRWWRRPRRASAASRSAISPLEKIVSGGQTGVDRAALDAARAAGLALGGWCPRERWAEDGAVPAVYPLTQTPQRDPAQRTAWNARDSDATLVLCPGTPSGGSALALHCARAEGRPLRVVDLEAGPDPSQIAAWIRETGARVLNVAGPRESTSPGVGARARALLDRVLVRLTAAADAHPRGE